MGYISEANKPLTTQIILRLLEMIKYEASQQPRHVAFEMLKVGAA